MPHLAWLDVELPQFSRNPETACVTANTMHGDFNHAITDAAAISSAFKLSGPLLPQTLDRIRTGAAVNHIAM
jgi:hypothetical protein